MDITPTRLDAEVKKMAQADQLTAVESPTMTPSAFMAGLYVIEGAAAQSLCEKS
jgi:hypothetical protein